VKRAKEGEHGKTRPRVPAIISEISVNGSYLLPLLRNSKFSVDVPGRVSGFLEAFELSVGYAKRATEILDQVLILI